MEELLDRLDGVRPRGQGRWVARCPAHAPDRSPSLSIREGERGVLVRCWAGCSLADICAALKIEQQDLFFDARQPRRPRFALKPKRPDRTALAFQFDLAGLDLRLRAQRIFGAGKKLDVATMTHNELDRALKYVASAHDDFQRADLFEDVADDLRERECHERIAREQQRRTA